MNIPLSHWLFELVVYGLWGLCLLHAWRQDKYTFLNVLTFVAYGFLLEYVGLHYKNPPDYAYTPFLLMLYRNTPQALPLSIVAGWGAIIYAALQTSRKLNGVVWYLTPFVVVLLGILIDAVMDPVASGPMGVDMWRWSPGTDVYWWFGVPATNYFGWMVVLFNFSLFSLIGQRIFSPSSRGLFANLLLSLGIVVISSAVNTGELLLYNRYVWQRPLELILLGLVLLVGPVILFRARHQLQRHHPFDGIIVIVPLFFYAYFLFWFLWLGAYHALPTFLWLGPLIAFIGLFLYTLPYTGSAVWFSKNKQV